MGAKNFSRALVYQDVIVPTELRQSVLLALDRDNHPFQKWVSFVPTFVHF
jgi:hypothetical protein